MPATVDGRIGGGRPVLCAASIRHRELHYRPNGEGSKPVHKPWEDAEAWPAKPGPRWWLAARVAVPHRLIQSPERLQKLYGTSWVLRTPSEVSAAQTCRVQPEAADIVKRDYAGVHAVGL
ncbi:hypothetical protein JCM9533A_32260 [Catenuloplanes niger JCM 9533]